MKGLIFTSFLIYFGGLAAADDIPVIILGPHIQSKSVAALKFYEGLEFFNVFKEHTTVDTMVIIVAEDQFSVEDVSHCKTPNGQSCFRGIQSIETKLYLPSVEDPTSVIEDSTEVGIIETSIVSSGNFSESLLGQTGKYVLLNFDDDNYTDESISEKLTRHDGMITSFYNQFVLKSNRSIVVVFTGKRGANHLRFAREALSPYSYFESENSTDVTIPIPTNVTDFSGGFLWRTDPLLLYYTSIGLTTLSNKQPMNVTSIEAHGMNETIEVEAEQANNETTTEKYQYFIDYTVAENQDNNETNVTQATQSVRQIIVTVYVNDNDTFEFVMTKSRGYWRANQFTWNDELLLSNRLIGAANGHSFHCSPAIRLTGRNGTTVITWKGLQLQPKFIYVAGEYFASFADAEDCVGFVSPGILSGMFVVFILVFILFVGIICLMDIKSNDRFENPKGPKMTFSTE